MVSKHLGHASSMQQTKKVVQYINKVGEKFYARKKFLPFVPY